MFLDSPCPHITQLSRLKCESIIFQNQIQKYNFANSCLGDDLTSTVKSHDRDDLTSNVKSHDRDDLTSNVKSHDRDDVTSNVKSHDRDALPMMIMKVSKYF
jgi:hypothetical protein